MKNHSPHVRQHLYAEQQQKRSSAPILNNHRLSQPPFPISNHHTRHSSFNPHHHIQHQQQLALNQPSPQPHRLSIAERFMSPRPPIFDLPINEHNQSNDPSLPPLNSDMISDTDALHPHSLTTETLTNSVNSGQPHDTLKQPDYSHRSSWTPSTQLSSQQKRHSRKPNSHADQQHGKRPPKSTDNMDQMEKSPAMMAPAAVTTTTPTAITTYTKGDRYQVEKNTMKTEPPLEGFWYCHRGCLLLCIFFFILVLGFILFLVWPRVPLLRIEGASVVSPVEIVQTQQGWMENVMFTTSWLVNVTVDNRQNYIPTRLNKVQVIVKDAVTNALVGKGTHNDDNMDWVLMDGISTMSVLVTVNYQARDMSDTTFLDLAHACHRTAADLPATSLPLHFWFTLYMFGFDWLGFTPTIIATPASSGFFCPV